jgi:flagellar hook-length control protein FliK
MKNLSLQTTDSRLLKPSSETDFKTNVNIKSLTSADKNLSESRASFQKMFDKQIQDKQKLVRHAAAADTEKASSTNNKSESENANVKAGSSQKNTEKNRQLQPAQSKVDIASVLDNAPTDEAALDDKLILSNKSDDDHSEKSIKILDDKDLAANTSINNIANIVMYPPMMPELKQLSLNKATESTSQSATSAEKQLTLGAEIKDNVLNNALSQGKNAKSAGAGSIAEGEDKQSHSHWLEAMLPNTAKSANTDDVAKLALTSEKDTAVKGLVVKELSVKEVTMPANFQSAMQVNASTIAQQLGRSNTINTSPGKAGWDQAISQKVVWMLGAQEQSATLTLNPPDLGPLQVVIHVRNDQADTTFISDNAEVRQALQDGMDNLRNKMSESGIQLGQANVNSGGQLQQQFQQAQQQARSDASLSKDSSATSVEQVNSAKVMVRSANGLVDTFA